jgi:alkylhydroperoxidase/carboxymuconolactone decarboxylase family protein YurZ
LSKALKPVKAYYHTLPTCFRYKIVVEDPKWFLELLTAASPAYDTKSTVLESRVRSLVCLAAASVMGWKEGIQLYSATSRRFGATKGQVSDVIRSVFKTAVSNAVAAGFRTPCHVPDLSRYRTMLRAYVRKSALTTRRISDPLFE